MNDTQQLIDLLVAYRHERLPKDITVIKVPIRPDGYGSWRIALQPELDLFEEPRPLTEFVDNTEDVELQPCMGFIAGYGPRSKTLVIGEMQS